MDPARATALSVSLGREEQFHTEQILPPLFHLAYFWDPQPAAALGRDGHPRTGGLIPDTGLPRRMWAGGRFVFHQPLRAGLMAEKITRCDAVAQKNGRSGSLALVTLTHEIHQNDVLCVTEMQDLVYRAEASRTTQALPPPLAPDTEQDVEEATFSTTQLFRYSALTFNGHRIHYDRPYACDVEGYDGLVVHGPLLAQLLVLMAQRHLGQLAEFSFRATAPLMDFETAQLCRHGDRLWVRGPHGRQCMTAQARALNMRL